MSAPHHVQSPCLVLCLTQEQVACILVTQERTGLAITAYHRAPSAHLSSPPSIDFALPHIVAQAHAFMQEHRLHSLPHRPSLMLCLQGTYIEEQIIDHQGTEEALAPLLPAAWQQRAVIHEPLSGIATGTSRPRQWYCASMAHTRLLQYSLIAKHLQLPLRQIATGGQALLAIQRILRRQHTVTTLGDDQLLTPAFDEAITSAWQECLHPRLPILAARNAEDLRLMARSMGTYLLG